MISLCYGDMVADMAQVKTTAAFGAMWESHMSHNVNVCVCVCLFVCVCV